jgi:uncharacterized protein (UPF0212 family)
MDQKQAKRNGVACMMNFPMNLQSRRRSGDVLIYVETEQKYDRCPKCGKNETGIAIKTSKDSGSSV